ncbi:hypothetical protein QYF36_003520 [Acer negundo]|nr:hypothetical protein QYF36_003520 [Acer negundo]
MPHHQKPHNKDQELIKESKKPHNKNQEHGVEPTRLMLGKTNNEAKDTSLHELIRYNHIDVVNKLIEADLDLPYEANGFGETPLYLAVERGYIEIVKKILGTGKSPTDRGPMNRTALHIDVIRKDKGCNALHLALASENSQMVNHVLKNPLLGNLVNQKEEKENTPLLQLATSDSFTRSFICNPRVDMLAFNRDNQNAADIILANDLIVESRESFLNGLGLIRTNHYRRIIVPKEEISRERKKTEETVAAILIAIVTLAAGFTLPGGYIGEDSPNEGALILTRSAAFQAFVIFDTTAFVLSCLAVLIHLTIALNKDKTQLYKQFKHELKCTFYAMIAMVFAFVIGIYAVLYPDKNLAIAACVIDCAFGVLLFLSTPTKMLLNMLKKKRPQRNFYYE